MEQQVYISRMIEKVPELRPVFEQHVRENDLLLAHVFMGAVTRFAVSLRPQHDDAAGRLLACLEDGLVRGGEEVRELIGVSFVENLIGEQQSLAHLRPLMGPRLASLIDTVCGRAELQ